MTPPNSFLSIFIDQLPQPLQGKFLTLNSPLAIQNYLDAMPYIAEDRDRSPLNVMLDHQSHCLDGGLFAALALWRLNFKPIIIDLVPEHGTDDDHVIALYQIDGHWGAVAKSNYVNLGYREAVYKSIRELVMTYFEHYCNLKQAKTLRGYTRPFDVSRYTKLNWSFDEGGANTLFYKIFYGRKTIPLIDNKMAGCLNAVSDRVYKTETFYTDQNWSFGNRTDH